MLQITHNFLVLQITYNFTKAIWIFCVRHFVDTRVSFSRIFWIRGTCHLKEYKPVSFCYESYARVIFLYVRIIFLIRTCPFLYTHVSIFLIRACHFFYTRVSFFSGSRLEISQSAVREVYASRHNVSCLFNLAVQYNPLIFEGFQECILMRLLRRAP